MKLNHILTNVILLNKEIEPQFVGFNHVRSSIKIVFELLESSYNIRALPGVYVKQILTQYITIYYLLYYVDSDGV